MLTAIATASTGADISADGNYRYVLWRVWNRTKPLLNIIGLNPSTADATEDDHTLSRCMGFAERAGFGGLLMTNLFAFRARDPNEMMQADDPVGKDNALYLTAVAQRAGNVLVAWGNGGEFRGRGSEVIEVLDEECLCFGTTAKGHPKHPLYLKQDTPMIPFPAADRSFDLARTIQAIKHRLSDLYVKNNTVNRTWWSVEVKKVFAALAEQQGLKHTSTIGGGEWLYDMVWYTSDTVPGIPFGRTTSIPLVMECEWGATIEAISEDFDKLLLANADLRVMVCGSYRGFQPEPIINYCETAVEGFGQLPPGACFLLCVMPEEEEKEIIFRKIVKDCQTSRK